MRYLVPSLIIAAILSLLHLFTTEPNQLTEPIVESVEEVLFGAVLTSEVAVNTAVEATPSGTNISSPGIVWTSDTHGYIFYEGTGGILYMSSTTDSGATWSTARQVDSINDDIVSFGVWWEGWTPGTTTTRYIHIVSIDSGADDTYYTRLDTQTGAFTATALGTTQAATCSESASCIPSITMSATGTMYMAAADGSDSWVVRCGQYLGCSTASNWHEITGAYSSNNNWVSTLLPVPGTDNIMLMYQLPIAIAQSNYSRIFSATSSTWWSQVVYTTNDTNTTYDAQMWGATISTTTGLIYAVAVDDANEYIATQDHDVLFYSYSTTTWSWTAKTNCVTDATGGIIGAKLSYDARTNTLYCIYGRRTTLGTATTGGIYYRTSTDGGTSWSSESSMVNDNADDINGLTTNMISHDRIGVTWNYTTAPRANQQFYDDIVDLFEESGGGGAVTVPPNVIWFD